jgi:membrane associated rhomboid family serine protease
VVTRALIVINALAFFYELSLPDKALENLFFGFIKGEWAGRR